MRPDGGRTRRRIQSGGMKRGSKIRLGLAAKLAVCVIASTAAFFTLFGAINLRMERQNSEEPGAAGGRPRRQRDLAHAPATRCCTMIATRCMSVMQQLGSEPGIQRIRIFNKEGRITLSTDAREVGSVVDTKAEACYGCHAQSAPLAKLERPDRARIFTDKQGHRLVAVIRPIENSPDCSNSGCHVHPASKQILGVIDADLSLAASGRADPEAPGDPDLVPGRQPSTGLHGRGDLHVDRGVPAGEGADRRHAPGERKGTWTTGCRCARKTSWAIWPPPSTR